MNERKSSSPEPEDFDLLSAVREWDVDMLLLEEVHCNLDLVAWLYDTVRSRVQRVSLPELTGVKCVARHSVSHSGKGSGETDVETLFSGNHMGEAASVLILIENKIDAPFTQLQPERYLSRCKELASTRNCAAAATMLIAPQAYLAAAADTCFDAEVSYEELIEHLSVCRPVSEAEIEARRQHRVLILKHALARYRRGGNRMNDTDRTEFFDAYFREAERRHPELRQKPTRQRSALSRGFFYELYPRLSQGIDELYMEHALDRGYVTIYFRGWGRNRDYYLPRVREVVKDKRMTVDAPPNRQFIQVKISGLTILQFDEPVSAQLTAVHKGADAAALLFDWYQSHQPDFESWTTALLSGEQ